MQINQATIDLIKKNEGCELHAYQDMVGVWTIGYGHIEGVQEGQVITQEQADQMLLDDLNNNYGPKVAARIGTAPTTDNQFGAMVSLAYNVGVGGFANSTVARDHCLSDYNAAAAAFLMWDRAGGHEVQALLRRRREEAALYLRGADEQVQGINTSTITDAIKNLQRDLGVTPDGIWGEESQGALDEFDNRKVGS